MPLQSPNVLLHASPRHRGTVPFHASASQRYAMPSQIRAKYCHCFVSLCIALALPCVAVPLRFTAVLCYAAAIPRSGLPRLGNSSLFNATAMSRFSSLCPRFSLHSLAFANRRVLYLASPLPCSVLRNFASAFHRFSMPQQFNPAQCHCNSQHRYAFAEHHRPSLNIALAVLFHSQPSRCGTQLSEP